jgi:hypothetical protein
VRGACPPQRCALAFIAASILVSGPDVSGFEAFAGELFRRVNAEFAADGDFAGGVITFYNPPQAAALRPHDENLPAKLQADGVKPNIPWLYNFKLDFRFK